MWKGCFEWTIFIIMWKLLGKHFEFGTLFKDEEHASDTIDGENIHCNGVQVEFGE